MKNFFENLNVETVKEFFKHHFNRIMFVVLTAIVTTMAILFNYMANNGYGNFLTSGSGEYRPTYYNSSRHDERQSSRQRQPWKMQKPSSNNSSKSSNSSGRH